MLPSDLLTVQKTHKIKKLITVKKKQHTLKNNLIINAQCKVVLLTPSCEGKKHDKRVADSAGYTVPIGSQLYQDTGFQGFNLSGVTIIQPKKRPKGGQLTAQEKETNLNISSIRIRDSYTS